MVFSGCFGPRAAPSDACRRSRRAFLEAFGGTSKHLGRPAGLAKVQARTDQGSVALDDVVVVVRHAEALRLEGIGPFGQPLFLFVTDGEWLALHRIRDNRLVVGAASTRNLERLFGIAVAPQSLLRTLLGDIPLSPLPTDGDLAYQEDERLYMWENTQPGPDPNYRVWFDPQGLHPVRFEMEDAAGSVVMRVNYGDFQQHGDVSLPTRIDVVEPATQRQVVWQYKDVQLEHRGVGRPVSRATAAANRNPGARRGPRLKPGFAADAEVTQAS